MPDVVIENPIINSPFDEPKRQFCFSDTGITDKMVESRRPSGYFVPIPPSNEDSADGNQRFRREGDRHSGRKPIRRRSEATLALRVLPRLIGIVKWKLSGAKRRQDGCGEDVWCGARGSSPLPRLSTQRSRSATSASA
jgi:hypothetical protein